MSKKPLNLSGFTQTSIEGKKAGIYVRVSSNEFLVSRREERRKKAALKLSGVEFVPDPESVESKVRQSVATQKEDAIRFCKQHNPPWEYAIYEDNEKSGTLGAEDRPNLQKLLNDVRAGKIHTIIVRAVNRFSRNNRHLKNIIYNDLMPNGVDLRGLNDGISISTPAGRFFTSILGEIAELEVSTTRENSMRNREQSARDGDLALNPYTYGYKSIGRRKVEIVPEKAEVVRKIFHEYAINKLSCRHIADILTEEKAPKDGENPWEASRIHKILHNPRYISKLNYGEYKMLPSKVFPRIIDQNLWDTADAELKRRGVIGPRTQHSIHLLTGLLRCPFCVERQKKDPKTRTNMFCMTGSNKLKYYVCQARHIRGKKTCKGVQINAEQIETFIEKFIAALAAEEFFKFISDQFDEKNRVTKRIAILRNQIARLQHKLDRIPEQVVSKNMSLELAGQIETKSKIELHDLNQELKQNEEELQAVSKAEQLDALDKLKQWKSLTIQQRRDTLRKVVLEMQMYPDKLLITLFARPDKPIVVPYTSWKKDRRKRYFPDVTDDFTVIQKNNKLIIRIGAEFLTMDGQPFRMHVDKIPHHDKTKEDQAEWKRIENDEDEWR